MLFKIIKVEAVEDKQYGHCTRICANAKPTGIKSVLPYSMITNKYGYDTYKLYVPNESYLIGSAQDAMNAGEFLDIDLNYFRHNEEWDWDDTIMDSNNSYYDFDFDKQNVEEEMEASKQQGKELHEFYLFDIKVENFDDGNGPIICVMATPVEYRIDEDGVKEGYYTREYVKDISRPFIFPYTDELYEAFKSLKDNLDNEDGLWTFSYSDFIKHVYHAVDGTDDYFVFYYYKDFENKYAALDTPITFMSQSRLAEQYHVFEDMDDYDEYDEYEVEEYDSKCCAEKHHYDDKVYDEPLEPEDIEVQNHDDDIFADCRQIMFLDNNPFEETRRYLVRVTTTWFGRVSQNHELIIFASSRKDAIQQIEHQVSLIEGHTITQDDFLSCVIAPA
jgi:hypothetical protein